MIKSEQVSLKIFVVYSPVTQRRRVPMYRVCPSFMCCLLCTRTRKSVDETNKVWISAMVQYSWGYEFKNVCKYYISYVCIWIMFQINTFNIILPINSQMEMSFSTCLWVPCVTYGFLHCLFRSQKEYESIKNMGFDFIRKWAVYRCLEVLKSHRAKNLTLLSHCQTDLYGFTSYLP